jgi:glycosyltransferase involved in cell wall biosynthesis
MSLSVCIVSCNEEENIGRTLSSVFELAEEIILVDSGSTDRTLEIARGYGPKVKIFVEPWKGFAPQKNWALGKASCGWVLLLDADESLTPELSDEIARVTAPATSPQPDAGLVAYRFPRRNIIFGRWIKHGGYYPDAKVRLIRRGAGRVENCPVNEELQVSGPVGRLRSDFLHHAHHTLTDFMEHVNRYSSLAAKMKGPRPFNVANIVVNPVATFIYNYFFRLGFLDGREGLLLHLCHSMYVSLKYAKAWELSKNSKSDRTRREYE